MSKPRKVSVTIQLSPEQRAACDEMAERSEMSRASVIRIALTLGMKMLTRKGL